MMELLIQGSDHASVSRLLRSGIRDGLDGVAMASDHPVYGDAHVMAGWLRRASAGEIVLLLDEAAQCPRCEVVFFGLGGLCDCSYPGPVALVRGFIGCYGEGSGEQMPYFMSLERVRALIDAGIQAHSSGGTLISDMIGRHQ